MSTPLQTKEIPVISNITTNNYQLDEQAHSYLVLLSTLRKQLKIDNISSHIAIVATIARWLNSPPVLVLIEQTPHWYNEWEIKQALYANTSTPKKIRDEIGKIISIFELMKELDKPNLEEHEKVEIRNNIKPLFSALTSLDKTLVKVRAYKLSSKSKTNPTSENLYRVFTNSELTLSSYTEADLISLAAEMNGKNIPSNLEELTSSNNSNLTNKPSSKEKNQENKFNSKEIGSESLTNISLDNVKRPLQIRIDEATTSMDKRKIAMLMMDTNEVVFRALLDNSALSEDLLIGYTRIVEADRAQEILKHPTWSKYKSIDNALLNNPFISSTIKLDILSSISDIEILLRAIRNPQITDIEIKQKIHQQLLEQYKQLSTDQCITVIKNTNGEILDELWDEAFSNEQTILQLLEDELLSESIISHIAKSKSASRAILVEISKNQNWISNYQIRMDLIRNAKTPHQVTARLIPRLNKPRLSAQLEHRIA